MPPNIYQYPIIIPTSSYVPYKEVANNEQQTHSNQHKRNDTNTLDLYTISKAALCP